MVRLTIDDQYAAMPWDELDAVVFDVGDVLLRIDPEKILMASLPDDADADLRELLLYRIFRSPYWMMLDHGVITPDEAVSAMAGQSEELRPIVRRVMSNWVNFNEVITEGVDAVRVCKAHGKKLYVLSNYAAEAFRVNRRSFDFFNLFDGLVISGEVSMRKPNSDIYQHLIDAFQLNPGRSLFIDDNAGNIEAALCAGLQGFCADRPGKLAKFLQG